MSRKFPTFLLITWIFMSVGESRAETRGEVIGNLITGWGKFIWLTEIHRFGVGSTRVIHKEMASGIYGLSKIDDENIVFGERDSGNINKINWKTGVVSFLGEGDAPIVMGRKLIFYKFTPGGSFQLAITGEGFDFEKVVVIDSGPFSYPASVVPVAKNKFVYYPGWSPGKSMIMVNSDDLTSEKTGVKDCVPQVWRSATGEVICSEFNQKSGPSHPVLKKLNGEDGGSAWKGRGLAALYIGDLDAALVGVERLSGYVLVLKDLSTKKTLGRDPFVRGIAGTSSTVLYGRLVP